MHDKFVGINIMRFHWSDGCDAHFVRKEPAILPYLSAYSVAPTRALEDRSGARADIYPALRTARRYPCPAKSGMRQTYQPFSNPRQGRGTEMRVADAIAPFRPLARYSPSCYAISALKLSFRRLLYPYGYRYSSYYSPPSREEARYV